MTDYVGDVPWQYMGPPSPYHTGTTIINTPSLSEQDKAEIRAMIHEEITAFKADLVREVINEINKQIRLRTEPRR